MTANAFELLLIRLNGDQTIAAEKYELLRQKLVKTLAWKGCPETEADNLADAALDRLANKLAQGEQIQNLNAYAAEVLRFVWLEHNRRRKEDAIGDDKMPENFIEPDIEFLKDPDLRLHCLRKCMAEVVAGRDDRTLIIGYYDADAGEKNKEIRRALAERLGLRMTTIKVKACRIRERLEKCINECVEKLSVTEMPVSDTNNRTVDK